MPASDLQRNYLKNRRKQLTQHRQRVGDAERWYEQRTDALVAAEAPVEMIGHVRLLANDAKELARRLDHALGAIDAELSAIAEPAVPQRPLIARREALLEQVAQHKAMVWAYVQQAQACGLDAEEVDLAPRLWWAVGRLRNICRQLQLAIKAIEAEIEDVV